jgi:hypothetical protein
MSLQLERGVVGYWCPMLATTGPRLYDRSGRGNSGTLTNMVPASDWVTTKVRNTTGRVLDFDGTNDYVQCPSVALTNVRALSCSAWFKATSTGGQAIFAKYETSTNERSFLVRITPSPNNRLGVSISADGGFVNFKEWYSTQAINDGLWKHAVFVFRENTLRVFINGFQDTGTFTVNNTVNTILWPSGVPIGFGAHNLLSTPQAVPFAGQIAEACIWNRAITPGEIRTLYRIGPGWFGKRESRFPGYAEQAAAFKAYWAKRQHLIGSGVY